MAFEERYYREELDYLRQLGKLLAQENLILPGFWPRRRVILMWSA